MSDDGGVADVRKRYRRFAEDEAHGVSPLYEELALAVTEDEPTARFLAGLPAEKQQPNLLFAAVRSLFGTPQDGDDLIAIVRRHPQAVRERMLSRRVQTNEPARCACLLPVLARLPPPLALLEVGASAGLCLLPDRYGYDYGRRRLDPSGPHRARAPVFACRANEATPLPDRVPEVVWRAGLDLHPVDVTDPAEVAWLETLVWPEHTERAARLRAAIAVARPEPPRVVPGDLVHDLGRLDDLVAATPAGATLVVFHSAVLGYLPSREAIARFVAEVRGLPATWVSNESPLVLPDVATRAGHDLPRDRFLLAVDGEPVATTGPHGQSIDWL